MERDVFKDHVATYEKVNDNLETLQWKKPGSSMYGIWFVRQYSTVMIFGDCGDAIFQWNWEPEFNLAWVAGCDDGYILGKCQASAHGREPYTWDAQTAREELRKLFADEEEFENLGFSEDIEEKFEERFGWDSMSSKFEWDMWCHDNAYEVFGDDWYEFVGSPGKRLDAGVELQLKGLRRAVAQLKEKENAEIQSDADSSGADPRGGESADGESGTSVG